MGAREKATNFLITGLPRSGKTTLVKTICQNRQFIKKTMGFYTQEIKRNGERIGFEIVTLPDSKKGILARKHLPSVYRVGAYGINLKDLDGLACKAVEDALLTDKIVVVDEIGKMELFSLRFKKVLIQALDSSQTVLATIMQRTNSFADRIKRREDARLISLSRDNFQHVLHDLKIWLITPEEAFPKP
ncbi:MAG: nucleoside-triphosphatase [Candidatus Aminicenantes bacterium]|jgi:nucleoside-triphosphatase